MRTVMNVPCSKNKRIKTIHIGGVFVADSGQWLKWRSLSPAERLEAASRLWLQSREIRKQTKHRFNLAI
jgi:hypothetical protein